MGDFPLKIDLSKRSLRMSQIYGVYQASTIYGIAFAGFRACVHDERSRPQTKLTGPFLVLLTIAFSKTSNTNISIICESGVSFKCVRDYGLQFISY